MSDSSIQELLTNKVTDLEMIINDVFLREFCKLHNIPLDQSLFNMKKECIAKVAYFLGVKKKYALRITEQEGVETDEIVTKGLTTVRSDFPSLTRIRIKELLELILKDGNEFSIQEIDEFDKKVEDEFRELAKKGDKSVGRPVSYVKSTYNKVLPAHIRGMNLWNTLEYFCFYPGSKGYMFKIKGVDRNKLNKPISLELERMIENTGFIVIPQELDRVPEHYIIDVEYTVQFGWIDRVQEILAPIGGRYDMRDLIDHESESRNFLLSIFGLGE